MASSLLIILLVAVATVQVAFATSYYSTCDPPTRPDYGHYSPYKTKYPIGSRIKFSCNPGYRRHGASWSACRVYNKRTFWTHPPPVCKPTKPVAKCPTLYDPLYGNVKVSGYSNGSTAYYSCNSGYALIGNTYYRRCYNGQWTGKEPVCDRIVKCPHRGHPQYGYVRVTGYSQGSTAYYSCRRGYYIYGDARQTCLYNGYWSGKEPVCKKIIKCPDLDDPNNGTVNVTGNKPDDSAHYDCDYGFKLVGYEYRECLYNGYWSGSEPVCKEISTIQCPDLYAPPYGSINMTGNDPGDSVHYECDYGFKLVGDAYRECSYDGYWSGREPVCKPITCPKLVAPRYGKVRQKSNNPSSKAYYGCDYGYELYGLKWRQCLYDGTWYGAAPTCRPLKKTCPRIYAPRYGTIRVAGYTPSSKAYYSCDDGYQLYGLQWRRCRSDGTWYGKAPVCHRVKKVTCPDLDAPRYGSIRVSEYTPSSKAYYSCDKGYKLYGLQWRKCQSNGRWYGSAPTCRPVKYQY